ncbi:hypothetical protein V6N12_068385 [Hibiscus sabdariffa]|uniref:Peptidase S8/S53 domain-containing protein n=1 Tax=Hibiscus sabdariffa TaxID=183260 RepID=A0ABR2FPY3_9ROSI
MDGVVRVIPNHILKLHTTRSWDFLGLNLSQSQVGAQGDVIIGLLDTGIWPEHESFNSQGLAAPPSKWKGTCQGENFTCNNKIIGARYYNSENFEGDVQSPRDSEGHGTHTSSTAAGDRVAGASYYGLANGTVRGGVPGARIAMYKLTMADFSTLSLKGLSINSFELNGRTYPLIWGGDAANYSAGANPDISKYCITGSLNSYKVEGRIVYCETLWDGTGVLLADGVGTIMADDEITDFAFNYPLPATQISTSDGEKFLDYIRTTENPIATILLGETWTDHMAPYVVSFSSRGPNPITPDILKPDLTAPGVDILAAWSPIAPPSIDEEDPRSVDYNIISGTSMSCPHASGAAAYVKAAHPDWSPAAIKSALMTTALGEKKSFTVEVTGPTISEQPITSGSVVWEDSDFQYTVRSPVVVYNFIPNLFSYSSYDSESQKKPTFQRPSTYRKNGILGRN